MENILLDWTLGTRPRKVRGSPRRSASSRGGSGRWDCPRVRGS